MKRKDCFFGLHFDYHANADTKEIGIEFDKDVIERIITEAKPDFIQCDTKGHPGYCSYMTNIGTRGDLVEDILAGWREVTKKHNVLLFSHYSGIWEKKATLDHPEWAAKDLDGSVTDKASPFGEYVDKLLIPQLKELALEYGIDGAWVDGECWALPYDISDNALKVWKEETGKDFDITTATEEEKKEYMAFIRKGFLKYVEHYITEIKKVAPNFELTSNWLNTSHVPDNIKITDYISGDLSPVNSVDSARYDGRIMQSFGRNWDIMSWGISFPVHFAKSAVQLCQEAAIILSLGGCFQIYNMQNPRKVIMDEWAIPIWAEVGEFCKSRKAFCHNSIIKPDIGVIYSAKGHKASENEIPFTNQCPYNKEFYGIVTALCDTGRSMSAILAERVGEIDLSAYNTIVISNLLELEEEAKAQLLKYAQNGGELLLCGTDTTRLFAHDLSLDIKESIGEHSIAIFEDSDYAMEVRAPYVNIGTKNAVFFMKPCLVEGDLACTNPPPTIVPSDESIASLAKFEYGKGSVYVIPVNIGKFYFESPTFEGQKFFRACVNQFKEGIVSVNKPGAVDVLVTEKDGKDYIHLVNLLGEHRSDRVKTFDYIPPVCDVEVCFAANKLPKEMRLQPSGKDIDYTIKGGKVYISLDRVELYDIIEITY